VAELPDEYIPISPDNQRKATPFFNKGRVVADTGNYDYSIEMYINGLGYDPEAVEAHQALRDISLKRKASGGKDLGMMDKMKLKRPSRDDKQNMLNGEKLMAYDPGNADAMVMLLQNAHRAGFYKTAKWIGPILHRANLDGKTPDAAKFIILKDVYKALKEWHLATEAAADAVRLRPHDMDLQTEMKHLAAQETMTTGGYDKGGDFRTSLKGAEEQDRLQESGRDMQSQGFVDRQIADARKEYQADTKEMGKLNRLVDVLEKTEGFEQENEAIELLLEAFERTKRFSLKQRVGKIKMRQMGRMERALRTEAHAKTADARLQKDYTQFRIDQLEFECKEYREWSEAYPTDMSLRFEMAKRLFLLKRTSDAIPVLQQASNDPKLHNDAMILLGRAFFESGFFNECGEILDELIKSYPLKGDERSRDMHYWRARALEQTGRTEDAIKLYSTLVRWDFNFRDVQVRIKKLQSGTEPSA
jgi:tetratricopeptide (TPR) repeat protein